MVTHRVTREQTPIQLSAIRSIEIPAVVQLQYIIRERVNLVEGRRPVRDSAISLMNQPSSCSSVCSFCNNCCSQLVRIQVRLLKRQCMRVMMVRMTCNHQAIGQGKAQPKARKITIRRWKRRTHFAATHLHMDSPWEVVSELQSQCAQCKTHV